MTQDLNHADKKTPTGMFQLTSSYKTLISVSSSYNNVNYNVHGFHLLSKVVID